MRWIGLLIVAFAAWTIFSIVVWLQPTIRTMPSGVSIASEISRSSKSAPHLPVREIM